MSSTSNKKRTLRLCRPEPEISFSIAEDVHSDPGEDVFQPSLVCNYEANFYSKHRRSCS